MVRLLQQPFKPLQRELQRFNPTMVRLLPFMQDIGPWVFTFQSHNGAIAASAKQ